MEAKRQTTELAPVRVAVIGAGPVGLEAALALSSGSPLIRVTVIESGEVAGAAIRARWGHVPLFSPWKLNQSAAARKVVPGEPPLPHLPHSFSSPIIPLIRYCCAFFLGGFFGVGFRP